MKSHLAKDTLVVDLHGLWFNEAYDYLEDQITYAPERIKVIIVIHGYSHGDNLLRMVREEFWNPKLIRKQEDENPGRTRLFLM